MTKTECEVCGRSFEVCYAADSAEAGEECFRLGYERLKAELAVERTRRHAVEEALQGLADAVADEANAAHSISGRIGARLADARAALSPAEGQPPEGEK